jgi:hypothetical protein
MSIEIELKTPDKQGLGAILHALAKSIETCSNPTVTINLKLKFDAEEKKK